MQATINCVTNKQSINTDIKHADGRVVSITIEPGKALVDSDGRVRFFTLDWGDGDVQGYKLHPHNSRNRQAILWVAHFLAGYGLSRLGGRLVKVREGASRQEEEAVHLARFFTFSTAAGQRVQSFVSNQFNSDELGYHNIITDKLIWDDEIFV